MEWIPREPKEKITTLERIKILLPQFKNQNKKIVTTNGCFDLLHYGHIQYLHASRKLGDILIVAINSDSSVKKRKGPNRPILDEMSRAYQLGGLESVDYVLIFEEYTPAKVLQVIEPDFHTKGMDYQNQEIIEKELLPSWGGELVFIPFQEGFSTTQIIEKMKKNESIPNLIL